MKKIIITGANGFIGRHLVNYLSDKYQVTALIRSNSIPGFKLTGGVEVKVADLTDKNSLKRSIEKGSVVVNLAANPYDPKKSFEVNVNGTKNLVEVCIEKNVEKLIQVSSQAVKIKNKGVYATTKLESESVVENSKLEYVILRPSLVYGSGEKGLFNKIKLLVNNLPIIPVFGSGGEKVYPLSVNDFCKAVEKVIENKSKEKIYDLGSRKGVTYNYFYKNVLASIGKEKVKIVHIPTILGLIAGNLFKLLNFKNPPFFVDNVLGSTQTINCNSEKFSEEFNIKFLDFKKGMEEMMKKDTVSIAVVGLGKMGLLHLSILSTMKNVKIVALVDSNKALFKTIKSMGIEGNFYENLDEAFESEKIDGVFILTPTFTHKDLIIKSIKNGKYVFVEKPMSKNLEELNEIEKNILKYKSENKVVVGYTLLFKKAFDELLKIIKEKRLGKIKKFKADYWHSEVFGERRGWMFDKKLSGG
jgi:nucleoside-diphosphate-sugar epimerase